MIQQYYLYVYTKGKKKKCKPGLNEISVIPIYSSTMIS